MFCFEGVPLRCLKNFFFFFIVKADTFSNVLKQCSISHVNSWILSLTANAGNGINGRDLKTVF